MDTVKKFKLKNWMNPKILLVISILFITACQKTHPKPVPYPTKISVGEVQSTVQQSPMVINRAVPISTPQPEAIAYSQMATVTPEILTAVAQLFPTHTPPATATRTTTISINGRIHPLVSGHPQPYLSHYRLLTFYGHPASPELGILGKIPREQLATELRITAVLYQQLAWETYEVKPTIHFISSVANSEAGTDGLYRQQTDLDLLAEWIHFAQEKNLAFIIDIQPGQADLLQEFERIRPLLYSPHVHLAIDPEFIIAKGEIPGQTLGYVDGDMINRIQTELNEIALDIGLNKVLIIHQFEPSMIQNKAHIQNYPYVEIVIDADGFGNPATKLVDYHQYAQESGWEYGGLKLFHHWDSPMLTPSEILQLSPTPALVIYQ